MQSKCWLLHLPHAFFIFLILLFKNLDIRLHFRGSLISWFCHCLLQTYRKRLILWAFYLLPTNIGTLRIIMNPQYRNFGESANMHLTANALLSTVVITFITELTKYILICLKKGRYKIIIWHYKTKKQTYHHYSSSTQISHYTYHSLEKKNFRNGVDSHKNTREPIHYWQLHYLQKL